MDRKKADELILFLREHAADDLNRLLLSASRYPGIDIPFVVDQLRARRQIKDKLPSWFREERLIYPGKLAAEQCSSELTASYKQGLIPEGSHVCDLTGGLGVDTYFLSKKAGRVTYIERNPDYCEAATHNFALLGMSGVEVLNGDSTALLERIGEVDLFYVDPARRGAGDRRVFALRDCEPDLTVLLPLLYRHAPAVVAKLSPMADIRQTIGLLPGTVAIHVLSVKNDCKELLFEMRRDTDEQDPRVTCVNFLGEGRSERFAFTLREEQEASVSLSATVGHYLYEPNASLLKAGAFKVISSRFGLDKLHISSHLYTSDTLMPDFPGRVFAVEETIPLMGKRWKKLALEIPRANITARNFPLSVDELRKRTKIADGGDVYLFATTLGSGEKVLVKGRKVPRSGE